LSKTSENHLRGQRYRRPFDDSSLVIYRCITLQSLLCGPRTGRAWRSVESYACKPFAFKLAVLQRRELAAIQASVQEFSGSTQADDITVIVARCR
jgi:hypothetical protein